MKIVIGLIGLMFISCGDKQQEEDVPDEQITLENCTGTISDNAPEFYKQYFSCVDVSVSGSSTVISSDNIPPYQSWYFTENHPNYIEYISQGSGYFQNPNTISEQSISISIPSSPVSRNLTIDDSMVDGIAQNNQYEYPMATVGLALNGVAIFNPIAAPPDDIEDEKFSFDLYSGHPTFDGTYHHHSTTKGPLEVLLDKGLITTAVVGSAEIELYGIMCDGTVILGCTELDGSTPDDSDFDAQNGHLHDISDSNGTTHFSNRYHTHVCTETFTGHKFTPEIQYYEGCN